MNRNLKFWFFGSALVVILIALPTFDIIYHLFDKPTDIWQHIKENLLTGYILTTIKLVVSTVIFSTIIATGLAWCISIYDFPLKKFLSLALLLPIAIPPYIAAYTFSGMLSYTGTVQLFFRNTLGLELSQKYFSIMNLPGSIFIFSLFLYPYTYITVYAFLNKQSSSLVEAGRLMGKNRTSIFFRVILPLLRVPIVAGSTLVALEVLSDYGVVSYFGVDTFSTAIFKSWLSFGDVNSAIRLSAILLVSVLFITSLEKISRGRKKSSFSSTKIRPLKPIKLKGIKKIAVMSFVYFFFFLGVLVPVLQMLVWAIYSYGNIRLDGLFEMAINTVMIAGISSVIIVILSLLLANYRRLCGGLISNIFSKFGVVGYSIPSAITAITMLLFFLDTDRLIGTSFSTTILMALYAYIVRYMAVSYQNVETGFEKIGMNFLDSSRILGYSRLKSFFNVDLPMMKTAIIGAFLITFVDIIKELTIILILRPFNYNTLSTKVFEYAHDEMIVESSIPSLIIVSISLLAVIIFYFIEKKGENEIGIFRD